MMSREEIIIGCGAIMETIQQQTKTQNSALNKIIEQLTAINETLRDLVIINTT